MMTKMTGSTATCPRAAYGDDDDYGGGGGDDDDDRYILHHKIKII